MWRFIGEQRKFRFRNIQRKQNGDSTQQKKRNTVCSRVTCIKHRTKKKTSRQVTLYGSLVQYLKAIDGVRDRYLRDS